MDTLGAFPTSATNFDGTVRFSERYGGNQNPVERFNSVADARLKYYRADEFSVTAAHGNIFNWTAISISAVSAS